MKSRIWLLASSVLIALSVSASAQSACPYPLQYGQVLTTAQWNACLSAGLNALPLVGGTLSGPLSTVSSTTAAAGFTVPYGSVPTSPNPGDIYNSADGLRIYDNGAWEILVGTQTTSPARGDIVYFDGLKWVDLPAGTSGYFLETLGSGANPQWANVAAGAGCSIFGGAQYQIIVNNGTSGCSTSPNASVNVGALSLGTSGALGSVKMGNATSGTVTLQPTTGALGTVTATLPANTGTIAELNLAQTWTATQTLPNSGLLMLGSSTGATTFTSANSSPSNYTITVPDVTDTMATISAGQTLTNKSISGSTNTISNIGNGSLTNSTITINGTPISLGGSTTIPTATAGQIPGLTTGSAPGAGYIGELKTNSGNVGPATNGAGYAITSIALTAGVWNCYGSIMYGPQTGSISTTANIAFAQISDVSGVAGYGTISSSFAWMPTISSTTSNVLQLPVVGYDTAISTGKTVYLNGAINFSTGSWRMSGNLSCRRVG
jgi:hypothetical protein